MAWTGHPDFESLTAAITADPADDAPRLLAADWLDDRGEAAHATFVRDQVRLATVPSWDDLAILARNQRHAELSLGTPFRHALPELPLFLQWHPEHAFRRGFGTGVVVRQLSGLLEAGEALFDLAPIDELWLTAATLDEWRELARQPWLSRIRSLHFPFGPGLIMPIRSLAESKYSTAIRELHFESLVTPAAGTIVEALVDSPLAPQLESLSLRMVTYDEAEEVAGHLERAKFEALKCLSLEQSEFGDVRLDWMFRTQWFPHLSTLGLRSTLNVRHWPPINWPTETRIESIDLSQNRIAKSFMDHPHLVKNVKSMQLVDVPIEPASITFFSRSSLKRPLRCLNLQHGLHSVIILDFLQKMKICWDQLAELNLADVDLRKIHPDGIELIPIPTSLVSLVVSHDCVTPQHKSAFDRHFGDRMHWAAPREQFGLSR